MVVAAVHNPSFIRLGFQKNWNKKLFIRAQNMDLFLVSTKHYITTKSNGTNFSNNNITASTKMCLFKKLLGGCGSGIKK